MKQGDKIIKARVAVKAAIFAAVIASMAFDLGLGSPSAYGVGRFVLMCPLGALEALLASKSFLPVTVISLACVVVLSLVFGRMWCSWGCPAPVVAKLLRPSKRKAGKSKKGAQSAASEGSSDSKDCASEGCSASCSSCSFDGDRSNAFHYLPLKDLRTWILIAVVVATFVAGFPIFCLVCPVGLTFGTVGSLWHLIVDKQVTLSALVFPLALVIELGLYKHWCSSLCPIAALLGLFGRFAKTFRPAVDSSKCLRDSKGIQCQSCFAACDEKIDLHTAVTEYDLSMCTRCGECVEQCPAEAIEIRALPKK